MITTDDIPDWDEYFLSLAQAASTRGKCTRLQVGAVIVGVDHRVLSTGYNGAPEGMKDCLSGACPRGRHGKDQVLSRRGYDDPGTPGYCIAIHAELNALLHCDGRPVGSTVYITADPCPNCVKHLAGAGVSFMVWRSGGQIHHVVPVDQLRTYAQIGLSTP